MLSNSHLAVKVIAVPLACEEKSLENRILKTAASANKANYGKTDLPFVQVSFNLKILKPVSRFLMTHGYGQLDLEMSSPLPKSCQENHH